MTDTASTTGIEDHTSYEDSAEQIAGVAPTALQKFDHEEFNTLKNTIDQHAPLINTLIADLLGIIAGSAGVTLASLKGETDALSAILSADDTALDTAQERVDKIKQLLADIDSLVIADIAGLQTTLDSLQTGKEATGVAQSLVTALEATIRGAGAVGVTLTSLKSETDALSAILSSDDSTLDTAQERVDKIKQLLSDIDTLAIGDVAGLQSALDNLQSAIDGKEAAGVAANLFSQLNLDAIAVTKSDTPVAVFIYDTRKDSGRGAWRHRTHSTSWYQEELDTANRGSRREFPSVAVIVAETDKVTIYDADDPTLPMWMIFTVLGFNSMTSGSPNVAKMLNGSLYLGKVSFDLAVIDFIGDRAARVGTPSINGAYLGNIFGRNNGLNWSSSKPAWVTSGGIINRSVNDLAITVLDDAPIDQATGLPVPTIAVATNSGVSIIKQDGSVVDLIPSASSYGAVYNVEFIGSDIVFSSDNIDKPRSTYRIAIPDADLTYEVASVSVPNRDFGRVETGLPVPLGMDGVNGPKRFGKYFYHFTDGLTITHENEADRPGAMVAYITADYQSGWMVGDIKGAYLASTNINDLVADRSVNANDLTVVGSPTLTPVATGAELLKFNVSATAYFEITNAIISDTLYAYCWVETAADVWELQHGVLSSNPIEGVSVTGTTLTVAGNNPKALLRITATTPSNHQIIKIDSDEIKLFQVDAKAVIFGTSSNIKDMDHDEVTDLLHVVTDQGRSTFDFPVRVDNTTESTSVIAAHDGLVVEG